MRERDNLEDLSIDWKIILKPVFKKWDGEVWTGFIWLKIGEDCCEFGNESPDSIKCGT
jgi:hypothetical protein